MTHSGHYGTLMKMIPLCVPFSRKEEARQAGARWHLGERVWQCDRDLLSSPAYPGLRPFVPRMFRPELSAPFIRPWMVPQTVWGKNLRALLTRKQWDVVRRAAYEESGKRCIVCGGRGSEWPVEADEAWEYDDATNLQTLKSVIALFPPCHHVRHWGKSMVEGREEAALSHMMTVNGWSRHQARDAADAALAQWHDRSRVSWQSDYSWVARRHGFGIDDAGIVRAERANVEVVALARDRATGMSLSRQNTVPADVTMQASEEGSDTITGISSVTNCSVIGSVLRAAGNMLRRRWSA